MTVARGPADPAVVRRLLADLACDPPTAAPPTWTNEVAATTRTIRIALETSTAEGDTVAFDEVLAWRNAVDEHLGRMERADPYQWDAWRRPGTFLDCLLRLRSLLSHVVGKAYWDEAEYVSLAEIDIERYLWGAR